MKRIFIGHRGVGKTSVLQRHKIYFEDVKHFDLDSEIQKQCQRPIAEIFIKEGEKRFREIEKDVFKSLLAENSNYVISVGGGFSPANFPKEAEIIFLSRSTDSDGRVFLNRPRLEPDKSPLDESKKRYEERHLDLLNAADWVYHMPEGIENSVEIERKILTGNFKIIGGYYTLHQQDLGQLDWLVRHFDGIELRSDLLSSEEIIQIIQKYPEHHFLVAVRSLCHLDLPKSVLVDCDYLFLNTDCQIISSHSDKIQTGIKQLGEFEKTHDLKLCPLVENYEDLIVGYNWQQRDPKKRSFLPRSLNGKWQWYRQWARYNQKINFIRGFAEIADQTKIFDWLQMPEEKPSSWGAVLGSPIYFSRSPQQHQKFFGDRRSFFTKVDIGVEDLNKYLPLLLEMGLKYASVTSPLKEAAFKIASVHSSSVVKFKTANTLYFGERNVKAHNSDLEGFVRLVSHLKSSDKVAIWGGGGTLEMMKSVLPWAILFSAQTGKLRDKGQDPITNFDYLIWAAPRSHKTHFPSVKLKVGHVIDLNYTDHSMGLEFAAERKIGYTSGLTMFEVQADEQQKFWITNEV
jgi:shikimate kinase/shikimate 5-dehydrogenase